MGNSSDIRRHTLKDMAACIIRMHAEVFTQPVVAQVRDRESIMGRRLRLLEGVARGDNDPQSITPRDACVLLDAVLDAVALQHATGRETSLFDLPEIGNPSILGPLRERRPKVKGTSDELLDWQFQTLVQAWAATKGFGELRDLRHCSRDKASKVCDFLVEDRSGAADLVECKRFHPATPASDPVGEATSKLQSRITGAADQLSQSAAQFGKETACRHFMADISAYCEVSQPYSGKAVRGEVFGFSRDQVSQVLATVLGGVPTGSRRIDKVSLCWRNEFFIGGLPRAIIHQCLSGTRGSVQSVFDYEGWTVEGYPLKESAFRELRASPIARSLPWIATSFANMSSPETFARIGPPQKAGT
jgi:hypothetical protein